MAKYKYNGKGILRTTLGGNDLIVEPGQEFEASFKTPNKHFDKLVSKGEVSEIKSPTPPKVD